MTKLLERAIAEVRELPEADRDLAADVLFALAAKQAEPETLDDETRAAIPEGIAPADRGEFVGKEEMDDFSRGTEGKS